MIAEMIAERFSNLRPRMVPPGNGSTTPPVKRYARRGGIVPLRFARGLKPAIIFARQRGPQRAALPRSFQPTFAYPDSSIDRRVMLTDGNAYGGNAGARCNAF